MENSKTQTNRKRIAIDFMAFGEDEARKFLADEKNARDKIRAKAQKKSKKVS